MEQIRRLAAQSAAMDGRFEKTRIALLALDQVFRRMTEYHRYSNHRRHSTSLQNVVVSVLRCSLRIEHAKDKGMLPPLPVEIWLFILTWLRSADV